MVTGIEISGLVLALLPFVAKSLSDYAQGIETLRLFRSGRYSRQYREWAHEIEVQRAVLLNNVTELLEDLVEDEQAISEMKRDGQHALWKDPDTDKELQRRLGADYEPFMKTMQDLCDLLSDMQSRLGIHTPENSMFYQENRSLFKGKLIYLKHIFSREIYETFCGRIDRANSLLLTLTEQTRRREETRSKMLRTSRASFKTYRAVHKHASSLYNVLIRGKYWKCQSGRHKHRVNLRLELRFTESGYAKHLAQKKHKFTIDLLSQTHEQDPGEPITQLAWCGKVLEAEAIEIRAEDGESQFQLQSDSSTRVPDGQKAVSGDPPKPSHKEPGKTVTFATQASNSPLAPSATSQQHGQRILDLCSAITTSTSTKKEREYIGFLVDELSKTQHYDLYVVKMPDREMRTRSLQEVLTVAWSQRMASQLPVVTRRDCLLIAATLASSVLQLHGNWLRAEWTMQDIVFSEAAHDNDSKAGQVDCLKCTIEEPYLSWSVTSSEPGTLQLASLKLSPSSAMIKCPTLFPLGLALVELALCKPLSVIPQQPADNDPDPAVASLKKATRLLPNVLGENGGRYRDVVEECLSWPSSRPQDNGMENEEFQKSVFQYIVMPLLQDLEDFDGKARIR